VKPILVKKASGIEEPFSEQKLRKSLYKVHLSEDVINDIVSRVNSQLYDGITTRKIYRLAFNFLKRRQPVSASRYHLKRALVDLGPDGFLFERLVAEIMVAEGFSVKVGQLIEGRCVTHEVDVVAALDQRHAFVECKLHQRDALKSDVKVALYTYARFQDILKKRQEETPSSTATYESWLVTSTSFSSDAIQYAECMGMVVLSFSYPTDRSLSTLIEEFLLYPITCLTTLSAFSKKQLLSQEIILCRDLLLDYSLLQKAGVSAEASTRVIEEMKLLCRR
jgi:hypothetical protein